MSRMEHLHDAAFATAWAVVLTCAVHAGEAATTVAQAIGLPDHGSGLAVVVGTTDGAVETALANDGRMVVQGLALSEDAAQKARQRLRDRNLCGLASVKMRDRFDALPYAPRLANAVVVVDWTVAEKAGLTWPELVRVTAPGGRLWIGNTAVETVRRRIADTKIEGRVEACAAAGPWVMVRMSSAWGDEWTHNRFHDAGKRDLALDPIDPSVQRLWPHWIDGEKDPLGSHAAMSAIVCGGGRLVSLSTIETGAIVRDGQVWRSSAGPLIRDGDGWRTTGRLANVLSCRDAYNGIVQWLRPWNGTHEKKGKRALAMQGDRIYTIEAGRLTASELRDGAIVYAADAPVRFAEDAWLYCDARCIAVHDFRTAAVYVFAADSGQLKWQVEEGVVGVCLDDGRLFAALRSNADAKAASEVRAFDATTGTKRWDAAAAGLDAKNGQVELHKAGHGCVLVSAGDETLVLSAADGRIVHRLPAKGEPWFVGDYIMVGEKGQFFDRSSGKPAEVGAAGAVHGLGKWACARGCYTERMFLDPSRAASSRFAKKPARDQSQPFLGSMPIDKTCITGAVVAHGMVYSPPQGCGCAYSMGITKGLMGLAPIEPPPPAEAFTEPGPLVAGPAFGKVKDQPPLPGDWPMFRKDGQRSAAGEGNVPAEVKVLWRRPLANRPAGPIVKYSWRAQHHHNLTIGAPVVANGRVFVPLVDTHEVAALDAQSGEVVWRSTAGGRIDSPPTIYRGLCLFGSRDGCVQCVRADDGQLVWRRRIAPLEEQIVVYGQFESRWPAIGSVLIAGDRGYATAGHSRQLGIMVWEFEPVTGKTLAYRPLPLGNFNNDVLVQAANGGIWLGQIPVTPVPATEPAAKAKPGAKADVPEHLHDFDVTLLSTARTAAQSGRGGLRLHRITADRWAWSNERMVGSGQRIKPQSAAERPGFSYSQGGIACADPAKLDGEKGAAMLWQTPAKAVWALALSADRVVAAGPRPKPILPPEPLWTPAAPGDKPPPRPEAEPLPTGKPADAIWEAGKAATMQCRWLPVREDALTAAGVVNLLDLGDGKLVAEVALPASPVQDGVAIAHGRIYLALTDGSVVCLGNPANKERKGICTAYRLGLDKAERLWETPVPDAAGDPIPACNGSVVVVKGLTKTSYLLDPASGKVLATYAGDTGINECHAAIMEDKVIMSRDGSHGSSDMSILGATPETFSKLFCHWNQPHPQTTSYHNKYMTWPMVEGRIFMRGWDGVYCYDLRANK